MTASIGVRDFFQPHPELASLSQWELMHLMSSGWDRALLKFRNGLNTVVSSIRPVIIIIVYVYGKSGLSTCRKLK